MIRSRFKALLDYTAPMFIIGNKDTKFNGCIINDLFLLFKYKVIKACLHNMISMNIISQIKYIVFY